MKAFVIAGEPSGDRLGGALMAGLRALTPEISFEGIGGPAMQAQGLRSRFEMSALTLMGIWEVLPRYFDLRRRIEDTAKAVAASGADVLIGIDSPDFCLRVARRARELRPDLPVVHYVAPSVWAWRPGRAAKMARCVDHVLALLPFEPPYMEAAGMSCDFVGHPVTTEALASPAEAAAFRAAHAIPADAPLLLCLPGSRRGEVSRLGDRFGSALAELRRDAPDLHVVIPTVPGVRALIDEITANWPAPPLVIEEAAAKRAAFRAADLALAASGTVSLELAANDVPMVIAYDMAPLSRLIIGRLLRVDTVTLVNLVADSRSVPEFLGRDCQPGAITTALRSLLAEPQQRAAQHAAMTLTMERLGRGGPPPGQRAAQSVLDFLSRYQESTPSS